MRALVFLIALNATALRVEAQQAGTDPDCAERLARSLTVLEQRSLLKEEHATGVMWLRLDAELALQAGDVDRCRANLTKVELLLGMTPNG